MGPRSACGKQYSGAAVPASFPPASLVVLAEHPSSLLFRPIPRLYGHPPRMRDPAGIQACLAHAQLVVTVALCGGTGVPLSPHRAAGWGWEKAAYVVVASLVCAFVPFRA